jgi:hypothetical protein
MAHLDWDFLVVWAAMATLESALQERLALFSEHWGWTRLDRDSQPNKSRQLKVTKINKWAFFFSLKC